MKKRMLALLLTLCMVVSLLPAQLVVAEGTEGEQTEAVWALNGLGDAAAVGDQIENVTVTCDGQTVDSAYFATSDPNVAVVTNFGGYAAVTCLAEGTVTILAKDGDKILAEKTVTVSAGISTVALTQGVATTVSILANGAVLAKFTPSEAGQYVFYWPNTSNAMYNLIFDIWGTDGWSVGKGSVQTSTTNGTSVELSAQAYSIRLANNSEEALSFDLNVLPATDNTQLAFSYVPAKCVRVGHGDSLMVAPVEPNGVLGEITWTNSNPDVVTLTTLDYDPAVAQLEFVAQGEVTITATNTNGAVISHTFYVLAEDAVANINFNANGGEFQVTTPYDSWPTDSFGEMVPTGKDMAFVGVSIAEPVSASGAAFLGWLPHVQTENGPVPVEGAELLDTAAALTYPAVEDEVIVLMAQWEEGGNGGDNADGDQGGSSSDAVDLGVFPQGVSTAVIVPRGDDPDTGMPRPDKAVATFKPSSTNWYTLYRSVPTDPEEVYDGQQIVVYFNGGADYGDYWYNQNSGKGGYRWYLEANNVYTIEFQGTTDAAGISYTLKETVTPDAISFPQETFEGVVGDFMMGSVNFMPVHAYGEVTYSIEDTSVAQFTQWGDIKLLKEGETTITATCGALSTTAKIVVNTASTGGEGGYTPGFDIPEDATVTAMVKDTKYDVPTEKETFFTFTAPEAGIYSLNTDVRMGVGGECNVIVNGLAEGWIFDGQNMAVSLEKDQTVEIFAHTETACKLWVAKENAVIKMEVVSQDKTPTYLMNAALNPRFTLKDVELKLTYEDGTTEQINGMDMYRYEYMPYYKGMPLNVEMVNDSTTATVFFTCANAQVQYDVKLDAATVTKFEVIPAADMPDIYENTMGMEEEGVYVYYDAISLAFSFATYQFTWSDGTVEKYQLPLTGQTEYHGVELNAGIGMDPIADPWTVGVHSVPVSFGELTDTLDIEIKKNNVKSIEILDPGVDEYMLGDPDFFANTEDGWIMHSCDFVGFQLKVNYTDGTSKTFTDTDLTDYKGFFSLLNNTPVDGYPDQGPYTAPGTGKVYMSYMGAEDEYEIKIVNAVVEEGNAIVPETAVDEALADKKDDTVTLDITTSETAPEEEKTSAAKIPVASVEKLIEEEVKQVVVEMDSATVTMDAKALEAITEQAEGNSVTLSVEKVETTTLNEKQQAAIQDKAVAVVISAELICNGTNEPIATEDAKGFDGGTVTVKIPFTPETGFKGTDYIVYYVADNGSVAPVTTAYADGFLIIELKHLSEYVVVNTAEEDDSDEPTEPTEPSKPSEPTVPETTVPEETTKPTEPAVPEETTKPTEPSETTKPTEATKPSNPSVPDTGDNSGVTGMMLMMLASGTMAAVLWLSLRKRRAV